MCAILSCCRGKASIISTARAAPRAGAWQTALTCMVGKDLENWEGPIEIFHNDGSFWADREYWAPEVHVINGAFYMFASFHSPNRRRGTQILRAEKPTGPFVPISDGPVTPADWECLDGTFFQSKDGDPYLVFCHEWLQVHDGEVCAMKLTPDLKAAAGEPRVLFRASQAPWVVPSVDKDGNKNYVTDGPWLHRCPDGRLMMLWSSHGKDGYAQAAAYSDNGDITGNWTPAAEPIFGRDGGHGMIFRDSRAYSTWCCTRRTKTRMSGPCSCRLRNKRSFLKKFLHDFAAAFPRFFPGQWKTAAFFGLFVTFCRLKPYFPKKSAFSREQETAGPGRLPVSAKRPAESAAQICAGFSYFFRGNEL